jgi:oligoendopeptidase F
MSKKKSFAAAARNDAAPPIDLSDYYAGPADPAIDADMRAIRAATENFAAKYRGQVAALTPDELAEAYELSDRISLLDDKLGSYSAFLSSMDTANDDFKALEAKVTEFGTEMSNLTVFFGLELAEIDSEKLERDFTLSPALARYAPVIRRSLAFRPHQLSEPEEKILGIASNTGSTAWRRFYEQLLGQATFPFGQRKRLGQAEILNLLSDPDRAIRQKAFDGFTKGLKGLAFQMTFVTNTLAQDKDARDKLRHYTSAESARNLSNNIEDEVVGALNKSVTSNYHRLSHRFYALKAQRLGLGQLEPWDRNAPVVKDQDNMSFAEARQVVIDTYTDFSPEAGAIAKEFFDKRWIDATQRPNKRDGAFAMPGPVDIHPLMFINWKNSRRDLYTLAHEMGHNIHQYLAAKHTKSNMLASTPLTLAETASVFGEKLVFERLLAAEKDPSKRVAMLFGKLDDMVNTVVRQIAFYNFELEVHNGLRREGRPLKTGELNAAFIKTQQAALGPAVKIDDRSGLMWSYIPHFINSPFYVYAYAFGDCLVNALYKKYEEAPDKADFVQKYTQLLKDGGTRHHTEALAPFGIDLKDSAFWDKGMDVFAEMIDRLEQAMAEEAALKNRPVPPAFTPA